jgi:hypothetical protein
LERDIAVTTHRRGHINVVPVGHDLRSDGDITRYLKIAAVIDSEGAAAGYIKLGQTRNGTSKDERTTRTSL